MQVKQHGDDPFFYTLYKAKTPIGRCRLSAMPGGFALDELYIEPGFCGKGYGSFFLKQILHATGGYEKASLHTAPVPASGAAKALLQKFGFVPEGKTWVRRRLAEITPVGFVHTFLQTRLASGGFFIDATCGNGGDTELLCRIAGAGGRVLALDIQPQAVQNTKQRLHRAGLGDIGQVQLADHANLAALAPPASADCVVFNFGYLPGGDHALFSTPQSSLPAVKAALAILKPGGVLAACLYSGGPNGTAERDELLTFFNALPIGQYTSIVCRFENWAGAAPLPCLVIKKQ